MWTATPTRVLRATRPESPRNPVEDRRDATSCRGNGLQRHGKQNIGPFSRRGASPDRLGLGAFVPLPSQSQLAVEGGGGGGGEGGGGVTPSEGRGVAETDAEAAGSVVVPPSAGSSADSASKTAPLLQHVSQRTGSSSVCGVVVGISISTSGGGGGTPGGFDLILGAFPSQWMSIPGSSMSAAAPVGAPLLPVLHPA